MYPELFLLVLCMCFVLQVVALCLRDGAVSNAFGQVVQVIQEQALSLKRCRPHCICVC